MIRCRGRQRLLIHALMPIVRANVLIQRDKCFDVKARRYVDTACDNAPEVRAFTKNWDTMRENASTYLFMSYEKDTNVEGNFYYSVCLPHHLSFSLEKKERISERRKKITF